MPHKAGSSSARRAAEPDASTLVPLKHRSAPKNRLRSLSATPILGAPPSSQLRGAVPGICSFDKRTLDF